MENKLFTRIQFQIYSKFFTSNMIVITAIFHLIFILGINIDRTFNLSNNL